MPTVMRPLSTIEHDPDAELIYSVDWSDWLNADASIATATWTIEGADAVLTKDNETIADDGRSASLRLKNGTAGERYRITCEIVTDESPTQTDDRSFFLRVQER